MKGMQKDSLALELDHVWAGYDDHDILKDVTLSVDEQEFLGIIGPNGGGKTTLLKVILGILKPNRGTVKVFGQPPSRVHRLIGYVPQYLQFDRQFPISVWDVVLMGRLGKLGMRPFYSKQDKEAALDALSQVQMEEFRGVQLSTLSGGQQQRVLIARALCSDPKLILLDEPTASIDKKMQKSIYELLTEINKSTTIILVTHDIGVLSSYVKKIGCINKYLIYHDDRELTKEMLEAAYECPVDLIAHGVPHRVFSDAHSHPDDPHNHNHNHNPHNHDPPDNDLHNNDPDDHGRCNHDADENNDPGGHDRCNHDGNGIHDHGNQDGGEGNE